MRRQVLPVAMRFHQIALSAAACLIAAALFGEEPECAIHYHADGKSAETFVLTSLTPPQVIERLPGRLIDAGVSMRTTEPEKGILKGDGLDVSAEASGDATRVTFRSSNGADKATLCRYASFIGNPPKPSVPQDPALIAQMKDDLIEKHRISRTEVNRTVSTATFSSLADFLELKITGVKPLDSETRQYDVSLLLPRTACTVASEDMADSASGFGGEVAPPHTKPVRVEATLVYAGHKGVWHLADVTIARLESTK